MSVIILRFAMVVTIALVFALPQCANAQGEDVCQFIRIYDTSNVLQVGNLIEVYYVEPHDVISQCGQSLDTSGTTKLWSNGTVLYDNIFIVGDELTTGWYKVITAYGVPGNHCFNLCKCSGSQGQGCP